MVKEKSHFHALKQHPSLLTSFDATVGSSAHAPTITSPFFSQPNQPCAALDEDQQNYAAMTPMQFVHDALFFILLLVWYTGARREEICKLKLDDVFFNDIDYIYIRTTDTGRVKSLDSKRKIPLHSELLRLGFLKYVEAMRLEGETLLFPEMYPAGSTKRTIGDVFYKIWWMNIRPFVPNLKRGQAMHAARHAVSDALKQAGVLLEERNDVLGHSQKALGEGASTYSEPFALQRMKDMVEKVPCVTSHLADVLEINLLPTELRVARPSRNKSD